MYLGETLSEEAAAELCGCDHFYGTCFSGLQDAATAMGLGAREIDAANVWADLEKSLTKGSPVIVLLDPSALYSTEFGGGHYVVILDANDQAVTFHDPSFGPKITVPRTVFEAAWDRYRFLGVVLWT